MSGKAALALIASVGAPAFAAATSADADDSAPCVSSYTGLRVTPPDMAETFAVPMGIEACELQVHPVTA